MCSELENSGIIVKVGDCSVTEHRPWRLPYQTCKTIHVHAKNTTNTTRTNAQFQVCMAMVVYRGATWGMLLRELDCNSNSHASLELVLSIVLPDATL